MIIRENIKIDNILQEFIDKNSIQKLYDDMSGEEWSLSKILNDLNATNVSQGIEKLNVENDILERRRELYIELSNLLLLKAEELFSRKEKSLVNILWNFKNSRLNDFRRKLQADAITELARENRKKDADRSAFLAAEAWKIDPRLYRLKWYAYRLYEKGETHNALIILDLLENKIKFNEKEKKQIKRMQTLSEEEIKNSKKNIINHNLHELVIKNLQLKIECSVYFKLTNLLMDKIEDFFKAPYFFSKNGNNNRSFYQSRKISFDEHKQFYTYNGIEKLYKGHD